jgi:Vacuolar 14 Fab1-binding region
MPCVKKVETMDERDRDQVKQQLSVDDDIRTILSVTPVNVPSTQEANSSDNDETWIEQDLATVNLNNGRLLYPKADETQSEDLENQVNNEDAFSSSSATSGSDGSTEESSDSGSETDVDEEHVNEHEQVYELPPMLTSQSEWDKALMTGKQSKGRAYDFFVTPQPVLSTDSSEFYSTAQAARATTPGERHALRSPKFTSTNKEHQLDPFPTSGKAAKQNDLPPPRPTARVQNGSIVGPTSTSRRSLARSSRAATKRGYTDVHVETNVSSGSTSSNNQMSLQQSESVGTTASISTAEVKLSARPQDYYPAATNSNEDNLNAGILPDMLMTMRQRIESINMFDSDILRLTNDYVVNDDNDPMFQESRESLKRSSQQSISAAVLVSLAHKRYERRRLAAMEIEKVVRSLVVLQHQTKQAKNELDRVRAILLVLSDDYVRSTNEDARKGGVVALAACAIGLKKANDHDPTVQECRDLILASVVHACQDHSQRVRYYATESLFNVVKGVFYVLTAA